MELTREDFQVIAAKMRSCGIRTLQQICFVEFDKSQIRAEDMPSVIREQIDSMCASAAYKEMIDEHWDFRSSALLEITNDIDHYVYKCYKCENSDIDLKGGKSNFPKKHRWLQRLNYDGVYSWDEFGRATAGGADLCVNCA